MDTVTGKVASYRGEQTVFPSPDDELLDGGVMEALDLKAHGESLSELLIAMLALPSQTCKGP